jgi:hypothetical protein
LKQPATPGPVVERIGNHPAWLHVVPFTPTLTDVDFDPCERDAILLALHLKADLVVMDDREGVEEARRLGLAPAQSAYSIRPQNVV